MYKNIKHPVRTGRTRTHPHVMKTGKFARKTNGRYLCRVAPTAFKLMMPVEPNVVEPYATVKLAITYRFFRSLRTNMPIIRKDKTRIIEKIT